MDQVIISDNYMKKQDRHSSKGNQWKWTDGKWWYKADQLGYEALSETVISHILSHSTIENTLLYEPVCIVYHDREMFGCKSRNFLQENEELITLEKLFRQHTGMSLSRELSYFSDVKKRISYTVDHVMNYTGLMDFGNYLTKILEMDAFFLNEDRHTNNIAVLYDIKQKEYRYCPYFDMALSLYADIKQDFPVEKPLDECRKKVVAKPFSREFDEQMDAANELYGSFLRFSITKEDMVREVDRWEFPYDKVILNRIKNLLRDQADKYRYMMC